MSLEKLKKVRLICPGVIIVICIIMYLFGNEIKSISDLIENGSSIDVSMAIPGFAILVFGVLYYAFNIRNIIWGPVVRKFQKNIVTRLLKIAYQNESDIPQISKHKEFVNTVFYPIIDNDKSLCEKSLIVKQNGAILSCTIDILIITFVFLVFWLISLLKNKASFPILFWITLTICILSIPILICLIKKHFSLSNEQLDIIGYNYKSRCKELVANILNHAN